MWTQDKRAEGCGLGNTGEIAQDDCGHSQPIESTEDFRPIPTLIRFAHPIL